jgi:hypothetical protein
MRSLRRKAWRNFIELCEKLEMSQKEVERIISKKGEHIAGDFILRVEREIEIGGRKAPFVSLWKGDLCCYKGAVNPYLFVSLDSETEIS